MICIKCGCPDHESDSRHCWNCGHLLNSNYCSDEHCVLNNGNSDDEKIPCREDACYCPECGTETEYFKYELIKPLVFEKNSQ